MAAREYMGILWFLGNMRGIKVSFMVYREYEKDTWGFLGISDEKWPLI